MRLYPFNRDLSCQCSSFLCVPVAGYPLLGHEAEGVEQLPGPVPLVWPDDGMVQKQMVMLGLSFALQRWHGDGTEVFRLAAPRQASPGMASLCNYHPSRRSCNSYSTQRMYNKIQARPAGKLHTGSTSKKMNALFKTHLLEAAYAFNVKNNSKSKTFQIHEMWGGCTCLVPTGVYLGVSLIVNLRWQHHMPEFPSYWDNLNDNVICHFVHKVIYPLSQMEVWGRRLLGALMSLQNWADDTSHFNVRTYSATSRRRLKSFLSRASIRLKGKQ